MTAPYGHTGAFDTLAGAAGLSRQSARGRGHLRFRARLAAPVPARRRELSAMPSTSRARHWRRRILPRPKPLLPGRAPDRHRNQRAGGVPGNADRQCVADPACIGQWAPTAAEDPDGHTLSSTNREGTPGDVDAPQPGDYPQQIALNFPVLSARAHVCRRAGLHQQHQHRRQHRHGRSSCGASEASFGLVDRHGYSADTWFSAFPALGGGGHDRRWRDRGVSG